MNEVALREKLAMLSEGVENSRAFHSDNKSPTEEVYPSVTGTEASIDDYLDRLRAQINYILFDLEATRRENRYLLEMLEDKRRRGRNRDGDPFNGRDQQ